MRQQRSAATAPRRVKTSTPGVYSRDGVRGRRYEFMYRDSEGRQHWKGGYLKKEDAKAARDALNVRLHRGERIAPSREKFADAASAWLARQTNVRPRTREAYSWAIRRHLVPRFGRMQVSAIGEDDIAGLIADMQRRGYSGWSIQAALKPLRGILNYAARKGQIAENPMHRLERSERPSLPRQKVKVLGSEQIKKVIDAADPARDRPLIATAVFTGLRIAELLGLTWEDIDFGTGFVHVRHQLDRTTRTREPVKTDDGERDVLLMPAVARTLKEYRLRSPHSRDQDFVFPTARGTGLDQTVARRALERAMKGGGLEQWEFTFHGLRHTFASILISQGRDVGFVAGQLGHSDPAITLRIYTHLFDQARHAAEARAAMEAEFGNYLETEDREDLPSVATANGPELAPVRVGNGC